MSAQVNRWIREHRNFDRLLEIVDREIDVFCRGERPGYELMLDVMHYLTRYADRFHHAREDVALARVAEREPAIARLVENLHGQHERIAGSGAALESKLDAVLSGALLRRDEVVLAAQRYVDFFRRHMRIEETVLFPAAERALGAEDWAEIDARLRAWPDPLFGGALEERYRALHGSLAAQIGCDCLAA